MRRAIFTLMLAAVGTAMVSAQDIAVTTDSLSASSAVAGDSILPATSVDDMIVMPDTVDVELVTVDEIPDFMLEPVGSKSIYCYPYSKTFSKHDWKRLWTNTAVLSGAFVGTLLVLECLPADATAWNRAEIREVPLFKRWNNHVIKQGPEWDHDNPIFNYVLHPYAGAAYFMAARSCGFNFWQSLLYSATISTVGWEFGIEAFMERPSIQDLFITPMVGSVFGELFYKAKRSIVADDYHLLGSKVLGYAAVFLCDPVNEVVDLFRGRNTACGQGIRMTSSVTPWNFSVALTF